MAEGAATADGGGGGGGGGSPLSLEVLADESLASVLACLAAEGVAQAGHCCSRLAAVSRADYLWLPLAARRWRFGAATLSSSSSSTASPQHAGPAGAPGFVPQLPPGLRDSALTQEAEDAERAGCQSRGAGASAFFARRCRSDAEVVAWVLQAAAQPRGGASSPSELHRGCVARIAGLTGAPQHNGHEAVLLEDPPSEGEAPPPRCCAAVLPSLRVLGIRRQHLTVVRAALSLKEAEDLVLARGPDAIDALARLAVATPATSSMPPERRPTGLAQKLLAKATEAWAEQQWKQLIEDADRVDTLEEGGLVISQWVAPLEADVKAVRASLGRLADAAAAAVVPTAPLRERVAAVSRVLFDDEGFCGNVDNYYDPRNSFLHCVLERKRGIPISLSIVWAAVARRVEVPCFLCTDMPMHILIRVSTGGAGGVADDLYVDAFGNKVMDYNELLSFTGALGLNFDEAFVKPGPATAVYARLLRNLRNIYQQAAHRPDSQHELRSVLERLAATCSQTIAISASSPALQREVQQVTALRAQVRNFLDQAAQ